MLLYTKELWTRDVQFKAFDGQAIDNDIYDLFKTIVKPKLEGEGYFLCGDIYDYDRNGEPLYRLFYKGKRNSFYGGVVNNDINQISERISGNQ